MPKKPPRDHRELFSQIEEATHLLRRVPPSAWLVYFLGTVPFLLYLFFFWSDMSRSALAERRLPESALLLGLLYAWMKVWHALFSDRLMALIENRESAAPMPLRGWMRLIASQMWIHATAPVLLIIGLIAMLPFPWIYAFYHNVTALAVEHFRAGGRTIPLVRKAVQQAQRALLQQVGLLGLLKLVAVLVYANLFMLSYLVAMLTKSISGQENAFSMSPHLFMSTAFQSLLISGCYFVMNPFVKALYTLRCFYGVARKSGADMQLTLRTWVSRMAVTAVALGFLLALPRSVAADLSHVAEAPPAPAVQNADPLSKSIRDVLQGSEFQWRLPRGEMSDQANESWIGSMMRGFTTWLNASLEDIGKILADIMDWLFNGKKGDEEDPAGGGGSGAGGAWLGMLPSLVKLLAIALALAFAWVLYRHWKQSKATAIVEAPAAPEINLESENVVANQLPENEWLRLAREKIAAGDLRLALRALFLATLANLGEKRLLHISRTKSNGDYSRELSWRARGREELNESFTHQVRTFDRVWYGRHEVSPELMDKFEQQHERITAHAS